MSIVGALLFSAMANHSFTTSSTNLILIEKQTGARMDVTYNRLNQNSVELIFHSILFTVNGTEPSIDKVIFPIDGLLPHYPIHNLGGDIVLFKGYPVLSGYEPLTSYFDMRATSTERLFVMDLSREYKQEEEVKLRTVDIRYRIMMPRTIA
jgi:hypothetical protein